MCLRAYGIDDDGGGVGRVRWARRLSDNNRGVGRGRGIDDVSERSETRTEALRIWGRRRRLQHCDEDPE